MNDTLIEQAADWLDALQSAASAGDEKAAEIYAIAKRLSVGCDVAALDRDTFEAYCLWVKQKGGDE